MEQQPSSVEINHNELKQYIQMVWNTKLSLNLTGTVGIGKSVSVLEEAIKLAEKEKREFIDWNRVDKATKQEVMNNPDKYFVFMDIRLSQFDATDLKGIPKINQDQQVCEWLIQNWLFCITDERIKGIVFFDEMNLAPPSVQASAYQIIRDKCMGDVKIGDNITIITAGNTLEDRANVYEMAKPLCNRFIHATLLPPDIDSWTDWAIAHNVDSRIIAYLQYAPNNLFRFDADSPDNAFPTPRGWAEYVNKSIEGVTHKNPIFQKFVASCVGTGIAVEFTAFQRLSEKINFEDILKNPELIQRIEELDIQYSLISIVEEWFNKNTDKAGCTKLCELVSHMQPEFAILTLKMAYKRHERAMKNNFSKISLWKNQLAKEYGKYLVES
jgi:hypothetical protein